MTAVTAREDTGRVEKDFKNEIITARKSETKKKHTYKTTTEMAKLPLTKIPDIDIKKTESQIRSQEISPFMITNNANIEQPTIKKRPQSPCIYHK